MVALEQNYRSTNRILEAANAVIENNRDRKPKRLWSELGDGDPVRIVEVEDEHAEARLVVAEIARLIEEGLSATEIAVFYRTNAQSRVLEEILVRNNVAYQVIGGPRFFERAEVKDALAYLRRSSTPRTPSRSGGSPTGRGGGSATRRSPASERTPIRTAHALGGPGRPEEAGLGTASTRDPWLPHDIESLCRPRRAQVDELVEAVLTGPDDRGLRGRADDRGAGRIENLQELVGSAQEYRSRVDDPTLAGFLEEVQLQSDQDTLGTDTAQVTLMTIHNAKGLEYRVVFMIGMEEGIFPHSRSIEDNEVEEERRLAYVGITRAKERLSLTHATARSLYGRRDTTSRRASSTSSRRRWRGSVSSPRRGRVTPSRPARSCLERSTICRALHRRLGTARLARGRCRHSHRARRGGDRSLRSGRQRAPPDARLRTAREDLTRPAA